jgi:hypothetical protein
MAEPFMKPCTIVTQEGSAFEIVASLAVKCDTTFVMMLLLMFAWCFP